MTVVKTGPRVVVSVVATDSGDWQVVGTPAGYQGILSTLFAENDFIHGFLVHSDGEQWEEYDHDDNDDASLLQITSLTGTVIIARPATPYRSSKSDGSRMDAGSDTHTLAIDMGSGSLTRFFRENSPFIKTLTSGDATPSVEGYRFFKTAGTTNITRFDNMSDGSRFLVMRGASDITIAHDGTNISLFGAVDYTLTAGAPSAEFIVEAGVAKQIGGVRLAGAITAGDTASAATPDAVKAYVDAVAQGLNPKAAVKVATTANITLSAPQTIDGVAVIAGDRVLVKNQSTAANNGIYLVAAGSWTRALDLDAWSEVPGAYVWALQGTANADTGWVCTSDAGGTLGSTAITFVQFAGLGSYATTTLSNVTDADFTGKTQTFETSALARTMKDRWQKTYVDPLEFQDLASFGSVTANDTAALRNAWLLLAAGRREIVIPDTRLLITPDLLQVTDKALLSALDGLRIFGRGRKSVIEMTDASTNTNSIFTLFGNDILIEGLAFDLSTSLATRNKGLATYNNASNQLTSVTCTVAPIVGQSAIGYLGYVGTVTAVSGTSGNYTVTMSATPATSGTAKPITFGNDKTNAGFIGIVACERAKLRDITILNMTRHAIDTNGVKDLVVENVVAKKFAAENTFSAWLTVSTSYQPVNTVVIKDCHGYNTGMQLSGVDITLKDTWTKGSGYGGGMAVQANADTYRFHMIGGGALDCLGIDSDDTICSGLECWAKETTVTGAKFVGNGGQGMVLIGKRTTLTGNLCKNNGQTVSSTSAGIALNRYDSTYNTNDSVIEGNQCYDDQGTKTQDYGVYVQSSLTGIYFGGGNKFSGNKTADRYYNSKCTGRIYEETFAFDTGTVSNGASATVTSPISSYVLNQGDIVSLDVNVSRAGWQLSPYVSGAGPVSPIACLSVNLSGSSGRLNGTANVIVDAL